MTEEQRQAKLEWKQQQYEAMAAGRLDDEDDKYNVDFVRKGYLEEAKPGRSLPASEPVDSTGMALGGLGGEQSILCLLLFNAGCHTPSLSGY